MPKRIAINGFGRIGRLTLRNLLNKEDLEVVAVNDLTDNETLAHLFQFDTTHGRFEGSVEHSEESLIINGETIRAFSERDPSKLPWSELEVDAVLECTGVFRTKETASMHLLAGARKVILSAPAKGEGIKTIVLGVNEDSILPEDQLLSNASCTTNCLAPLVKVILDNWGIEGGFMTTIHAYTSSQRLMDAPHKDLRRARAAAQNIVPTTTGAAKALSLVIPEIKGKIEAMAVRVPVICGSLTELSCLVSQDVSVEEVNETFRKASEENLKGILEYSNDHLVSSDILTNSHSCIFDSLLTKKQGDRMIKVVGWYDNEAGYSSRLADLAKLV